MTVYDLKVGDVLTLKRPGIHGDWKTATVFPDRWPTLPIGTKVKFVKRWLNFYGVQIRVDAPNGATYDLDPDCFE